MTNQLMCANEWCKSSQQKYVKLRSLIGNTFIAWACKTIIEYVSKVWYQWHRKSECTLERKYEIKVCNLNDVWVKLNERKMSMQKQQDISTSFYLAVYIRTLFLLHTIERRLKKRCFLLIILSCHKFVNKSFWVSSIITFRSIIYYIFLLLILK